MDGRTVRCAASGGLLRPAGTTSSSGGGLHVTGVDPGRLVVNVESERAVIAARHPNVDDYTFDGERRGNHHLA